MKFNILGILTVCLAFVAGIVAQSVEESGKPRLVVDSGDFQVDSVAFSSDGNELVTVGGGAITFRDIATGKELRRTAISESDATVAFSSDGKMIASAGNKTIEIFRTDSGEKLISWKTPAFEGRSIAFSPDGRTLAGGGSVETLKLWDVKTGTELGSFKHWYPHANKFLFNIYTVVFSPDGKVLASGSNHNTVTLWDIKTGKMIKELEAHESFISSLAFSKDGETLVSGSGDRTLKIWDWRTGRELKSFRGHEGEVTSVAISPDGNLLASGSQDTTVRLWDAATGKELKTIKRFPGFAGVVAFSPNGKIIASSSDQSLSLWSVNSERELNVIQGKENRISSFSISPGGKSLAIAHDYLGGVRLWDMSERRELKSFSGGGPVAFSPDGSIFAYKAESLVAVEAEGKSDRKPDDKNDKKDDREILEPPKGGLEGDEKSDSYENEDEITITTLELREARTGKVVKSIKTSRIGMKALVFSPDGKLLASGASFGKIDLWDVDTGKMLRSFKLHSRDDYSASMFIAFAPAGKSLAAKGTSGTIKVWNITTGKELRILKSKYGGSIAFSPDGKIIASSNENGRVQLWELTSGKELNPLEGNQYADSLVFSPDGRKIVNQIGADRRIWDVETGKESKYELIDDWVRLSDAQVGWFITRINGKMISVEREGSEITLTDANAKELLAKITFVDEKDWVVTAPDGRFDASEGAFEFIHVSDGSKIMDLGKYKSENYVRGLLQKVLGFKKDKN